MLDGLHAMGRILTHRLKLPILVFQKLVLTIFVLVLVLGRSKLTRCTLSCLTK